MTRVDGIREQAKNTQNKEEKMNARKVLCVVCVLVVGLALVLETAVLAAPPSLEYKLGEMPIYAGAGYDPAPKVSVPLYRAGNSKLPSFYRDWTSSSAVPNLHPLFHYSLDNNRAPEVRVPTWQSGSKPIWNWSGGH